MSATDDLLVVENLKTTFDTEAGELVAVDEVDFTVDRGETVCIVGESGSGKTVATESITRLVKEPPGRVEGSIRFDGQEIMDMSEPELRDIRGDRIANIFQNPQDAMNHCYSVGWQIVEALQVHQDISDEKARARAVDLLDRVGIPNASARFDDYPHEFSGGQKQRAMIAMALIGNPDLLIADEPTTALDVTVQSQILNLLEDLQEEFGMGILFVTHDLGVVAEVADRVVVMYAGKVMERGDVYDVFERPAHPYTQDLMTCLPGRGGRLEGIPGSLPDPTDPPDGCRFADRCDHAVEECKRGEQPPEIEFEPNHQASCIYYGPGYDNSVVRNEDLELDESDRGMEAGDD
jgi:peptide/nickel transport system ATP-binding protein